MGRKRSFNFHISRSRLAVILLLIYDAFAVNFSYLLALWLRFDCQINDLIKGSPEYLEAWVKFVPVYTVVSLVVFWAFKLYRSIWTFASYREFFNVLYSTAVTSVFHAVGITIFINLSGMAIRRMPITF